MHSSTRSPLVALGISLLILLARGNATAQDTMLIVDNATRVALLLDPATDTITDTVPLGFNGSFAGDCGVLGSTTAFVTNSAFQLVAVDLTTTPPSVPSPPVSISNSGQDVALTGDGRFVVTCNGSSFTPISVVDVATRTEVATSSAVNYCNSVDVCSDGSVLVTSEIEGQIRRLEIDGSGHLTDTGEFFPTVSPSNVYCAPDATSGVLLASGVAQTFGIPGLDEISQAALAGDEVSGAFDNTGERFYARSGAFLEAFDYTPASGGIGSVAAYTVNLAWQASSSSGNEQLALDPTGTKIYVSQFGFVEVFAAVNGSSLGTITHPALAVPTGICRPLRSDADSDGLSDDQELQLGTDPTNPDTDGDGLLDGWEVDNGFDPLTAGDDTGDPDGDGLPNLGEQSAGSDPRNPDTDGDSLSDGDEVDVYGTDPRNSDTDDDRLGDGDEVNGFGTDPLNPDTDSGGRRDGDEVLLDGTDPLIPSDDRIDPQGMIIGGLSDAVFLFDPSSDTVTDVVSVGSLLLGDCAVLASRTRGFATAAGFNLWALDLESSPPGPATGTNPVGISSTGVDLAVTPDDRYVLACGEATVELAVVDTATQAEVGGFSDGVGCSSVDVCSDGSVLVTSRASQGVFVLNLDEGGNLSDSGVFLPLEGEPRNVYCAPGSRSGVAIGAFGLVSFTLPGLAPVSLRDLPGTGISGTIHDSGDRVYVNTNAPAKLLSYSFDPFTGALGNDAAFTTSLPGRTPGEIGIEELALDPSGTKLYVVVPGGVNIYQADAGAFLGTLSNPSLLEPLGICVPGRQDADGDGLLDPAEARLGTDVDNPDTDGDGLLDGFEVNAGFDPLTPGEQGLDLDGDGLTSLDEQENGTDPDDPDSDGDGLSDGDEVATGSNPRTTDSDYDGVLDPDDNCPSSSNADQADLIHPNGIGDACDDPDADGVPDLLDNCVDDPNPGQEDVVHPDGLGDACDDPDGDAIQDDVDNCPDLSNSEQEDADGDGVGSDCDLCPQIRNPTQQETIACLQAREDGGQCQEAAIRLLEEDLTGEIQVLRAERLERIVFDVFATRCGGPENLAEFFLNGRAVGSVALDPLSLCVCDPPIVSLVVDDPDLLALWKPGTENRIRFKTPGVNNQIFASRFLGWTRATFEFSSSSLPACLLDINGGSCDDPDFCASSSERTFEELDVTRVVTDPGSLEAFVPFAGTVPQVALDISTLPDGDAGLCVAATSSTAAGALYGNTVDGDLVIVDVATGSTTPVGFLPETPGEIEFDNATGRAFAQLPLSVALAGYEFDLRDGTVLGSLVSTSGSFTGLEWIGNDLYGTVIFSPTGASTLAILDPATGAATFVGLTRAGAITGLAHDPRADVLYGIEGTTGNLLLLSQVTGAAVVVGSTGLPTVMSLEFGPDGQLYAGAGGTNGELYRVDPLTGAAEFVGLTGGPPLTGLTLAGEIVRTDCAYFLNQGEDVLALNGASCGPPTAIPEVEPEVECTSAAGATVNLDGSASQDPDSTPDTNDDIIRFEWLTGFGTAGEVVIATGEIATADLPLGETVVTLRVTDRTLKTDTADVIARVVDQTPPEIVVTTTPRFLWPPNRRMVPVTATLVVSDACGTAETYLVSIESNQPELGRSRMDPGNDIQGDTPGTLDLEFMLRAERVGGKRVYTVTYEATDAAGNVSEASALVPVASPRGGNRSLQMLRGRVGSAARSAQP